MASGASTFRAAFKKIYIFVYFCLAFWCGAVYDDGNDGERTKMIKKHTFNGTEFNIDFVRGIDGVCDRPDLPDKPPYNMLVLDGNGLTALHSVMHEALEASGFCDSCLHDEDGDPRTWDAARFVWRWINERL